MTPAPRPDDGPLAILALGGRLPVFVAKAVAKQGRAVFIIGLRGLADWEIEDFPHEIIPLLTVGRAIRTARAHGCREVVLAGAFLRPRLLDLRLDWGTIRRLPLFLAARGLGDDTILRRVTAAIEAEGFRVRGIGEVAPELAGGLGSIADAVLDADAAVDARIGFALLDALGPHDVGQACIVHRRRVLAIEAAEGTNAMIRRVEELRAAGRLPEDGPAGILVKAPKPQQELRNDMPVLGPDTVEAAAKACLKGIVWAAPDRVILLDAPAMIRAANAAGIALCGMEHRAP